MKAFDLERKTRASEDASAGGGLVLARQVDHVVGEVEGNFIQRKVRELDFFREHDVAVAVIAGQRSGPVGTHGEFPDLKFLGGNSFVVRLNDRDFIEEPIRSAMLSQVLRAVGVKDVAVDGVPIPVFTAGELLQVAFVECRTRRRDAWVRAARSRRGLISVPSASS